MVFWCLGVDWRRAVDKIGLPHRLDSLFHLAFCWEWWAVANYRLAYWASHRALFDLDNARFARRLMFLQQAMLLRFCYFTGKIVEGLSGARLNAFAEIGPGLLLVHTGSCGIGPGVHIGHTFTLYQDASVHGRHGNDPPTLGDNVTLYSGARVIGAVTVADNVRVGANALVLHDIPSNCVAVGVPARPLCPGDSQPSYPAGAQLHDMLITLAASGDLKEVGAGSYLDETTGIVFTVGTPQGDDAPGAENT